MTCRWQDCDKVADSLFCEEHYPEVFEQVSTDARLYTQRLRLEQRWWSFLYFIPTDDGYVKIGTTRTPSKRLEQWRAAEPSYRINGAVITRGSEEVELEIFDLFTDLSDAEREVFRADPAIWNLAKHLARAGHNLMALEWTLRGARSRRQAVTRL